MASASGNGRPSDPSSSPSEPVLGQAQPDLTKAERQSALTELVLRSGTLRIEDLAEHFRVSVMTVHRDLDTLEARGLLRKSRGVATAVASRLFEATTSFRTADRSAQKRGLAQAALGLVEPGQAIIMDDSTTGLYLAELLVDRPPLTVVTNFNALITSLTGHAGLTLICLGGEYVQWCDAYMGKMTTDALHQLRADMFFMSTSAIIDDTCFHQTEGTVQVKRAMFEAAERRVLYVDHAKFERRALHALGRLDEFDVVIVDDQLPDEHLARLERSGVNLLVAPSIDV